MTVLYTLKSCSIYWCHMIHLLLSLVPCLVCSRNRSGHPSLENVTFFPQVCFQSLLRVLDGRQKLFVLNAFDHAVCQTVPLLDNDLIQHWHSAC